MKTCRNWQVSKKALSPNGTVIERHITSVETFGEASKECVSSAAAMARTLQGRGIDADWGTDEDSYLVNNVVIFTDDSPESSESVVVAVFEISPIE